MDLRTIWLGLMAAACLAFPSVQAAEQQDPAHAAEMRRGPNGGTLLVKDDVTVELRIVEHGAPPEYRAWVTHADREVTQGVDLKLTLTRLGGQQDQFDFIPEGGYWRADGIVTEPHSFDVDVRLVMEGRPYRWQWASHEGRTTIPAKVAEQAGIVTAEAGPATLQRVLTVYGLLEVAPERRAALSARFPGLVTRVNANLGDRVHRGDVLAEIESNESLRGYALRAPIDGMVIARDINSGEVTGERPLFVIADMSTLWAALRVFPGHRQEVVVGQTVGVITDGRPQAGAIQHVLPPGEGRPYTVARVAVDNPDGLLAPGQMVAADIVVETFAASVAVDNRALQSFRDWTVVFIQVGDTYEIRPLELGRRDDEMTEVRSGLRPGDRYVVENSYLIKADIEKSGASHDH